MIHNVTQSSFISNINSTSKTRHKTNIANLKADRLNK